MLTAFLMPVLLYSILIALLLLAYITMLSFMKKSDNMIKNALTIEDSEQLFIGAKNLFLPFWKKQSRRKPHPIPPEDNREFYDFFHSQYYELLKKQEARAKAEMPMMIFILLGVVLFIYIGREYLEVLGIFIPIEVFLWVMFLTSQCYGRKMIISMEILDERLGASLPAEEIID